MRRVKIAIQKSGRLHDASVSFLQGLNLSIPQINDVLFYSSPQMPLEILCIRDDDIPELLAAGACDYGIVGENVFKEFSLKTSQNAVKTLNKLDFGYCRLSLAGPNNSIFNSLQDLNNKRIATSYPYILADFLKQQALQANITTLAGAVEIAPRLGIADLICDLVSTGKTLVANDLQEMKVIMTSQAVLLAADRVREKFCWFEQLVFSQQMNQKAEVSC
jgi:ATP phosphoribosyltransferase